jgi:hypothetical protein
VNSQARGFQNPQSTDWIFLPEQCRQGFDKQSDDWNQRPRRTKNYDSWRSVQGDLSGLEKSKSMVIKVRPSCRQI